MWLTAPNRIGIAAWKIRDLVWQVTASDDSASETAIRIGADNGDLRLVSSDGTPLPRLEEQFVRGDELHLSFPQVSDRHQFGFRVVLRPVALADPSLVPDEAVSGDQIAIEMLVSIQTTLLDAHPTLDLVFNANASPSGERSDDTAGSIQLARTDHVAACVLLGPHDAPFTTTITGSDELRLRLFGEFLEKGVIRRARPWIILDRTGDEIVPDLYESMLDRLAESPIPLT